ncbi:MAG: hypothetical protein HY608_09135, partial [Planctomycetes bacterium]|nr:hypothetical protein [Planctomycetota bacterium]
RLVVAGYAPVLLCAPQIRPQVKKLTDSASLGLHVLSYNEVPPDMPREIHGVIAVPEGLEAPVAVKA